MIKFALRLDKDKETKWLNDLAKEGHALTGFCAGFYKFEDCKPGEYEYQVDLTDGLFRVTEDYREFMQEAGIEIVCCWGYWVILRKKASEGEFKLYTDVESSIEHYKKIRNMFKVVTVIELICFYMEVIGAMRGSTAGFVGMVIIALFLLALANITVKTSRIIGELQGRAGRQNGYQKRPVNSFLLLGLLLNSANLMIQDSVSDVLHGIIVGVALGLMLIGLYQMSATYKETKE